MDSLDLPIIFSVTGPGQAQLRAIGQGLNMMAAQAGMVGSATGKSSQVMGLFSDKTHSSELRMLQMARAALSFQYAFQGMANVGTGLMDIGVGIMEGFQNAATLMLEEMGEVELSITRIAALSNTSQKEARVTAEKVLDIAFQLPGTMRDLTNLTANLAEAGLNATTVIGTYASLSQKGAVNKESLKLAEGLTSEAEKQVTLASSVVDLAAAMGETGSRFSMFQYLFSDYLKTGLSQKIRGRLTFEARDAISKEAKKGGGWDPKAAVEGFLKYMGTKGLFGSGLIAARTWEGIKEKFADLPRYFAKLIGGMPGTGGMFDQLVSSLYEIQQLLFQTFDDPKFAKSIQGAIIPAFRIMVGITKQLAAALGGLFQFIAEFPILTKLAVALTGVAGVVLTFVGAVIALVGSLGAFAALIMLLSDVILPALAIAIGTVVIGFQVLVPILAVATAAGAAFYAVWTSDFGGIRTTIQNLFVLGSALMEVIENLDKFGDGWSAIEEDTFKDLEDQGLLNTFSNMVQWIARAHEAYKTFMGTFTMGWSKAGGLGERFSNVWVRLSEAMLRVGTAVQQVLVALNLIPETGSDSMDNAAEAGHGFANALLRILDLVAKVSEGFADWVDATTGDVPRMMTQMNQFYSSVLMIKNAFDMLVDSALMFGGMLLMGLGPVLGMLVAITATTTRWLSLMAAFATGDFKGIGKILAGPSMVDDMKLGMDIAGAFSGMGMKALGYGMTELPKDAMEFRDAQLAMGTGQNAVRGRADDLANDPFSVDNIVRQNRKTGWLPQFDKKNKVVYEGDMYSSAEGSVANADIEMMRQLGLAPTADEVPSSAKYDMETGGQMSADAIENAVRNGMTDSLMSFEQNRQSVYVTSPGAGQPVGRSITKRAIEVVLELDGRQLLKKIIDIAENEDERADYAGYFSGAGILNKLAGGA